MRKELVIGAAFILFSASLSAQVQEEKCVGKPMKISGNVVAFDPVLHAALPVQGLFHEEDLIVEVKPTRIGEASKYLKVHIKTNRGFSLGDAAFSGGALVQLKARKCAKSPKTVPILIPSEAKTAADEKEETLIPAGKFALTERYRGKFQDTIPVSAAFCFKE